MEDFPKLSCPKPQAKGGVALSGGRDSLLALDDLVRRDGPNSWVALHVDHGSRNLESREAECREVEKQCHYLGVELRRKVLASGIGDSEEALRDARYVALATMGDDLDFVVLGHHVHDQVETILMKILRGSDLGGLAGMPSAFERNGVLFSRPMLEWSEDELERMRERLTLDAFEDPSNEESRYLRNRFRHELTPLLNDLSPGWVGRLSGLADSARLWKGGLEAKLDQLSKEHIWERVDENHYKMAREWLEALDPYILRAWSRRQLEWVAEGAKGITRRHVDSFAEFASSDKLGSHSYNFPGKWRLRGQKRWLHLLRS